jgi:hypothetical protein
MIEASVATILQEAGHEMCLFKMSSALSLSTCENIALIQLCVHRKFQHSESFNLSNSACDIEVCRP